MRQHSGVSLCFLRFNKSASVGQSGSQEPTDSNLDKRQRKRAREEEVERNHHKDESSKNSEMLLAEK